MHLFIVIAGSDQLLMRFCNEGFLRTWGTTRRDI